MMERKFNNRLEDLLVLRTPCDYQIPEWHLLVQLADLLLLQHQEGVELLCNLEQRTNDYGDQAGGAGDFFFL